MVSYSDDGSILVWSQTTGEVSANITNPFYNGGSLPAVNDLFFKNSKYLIAFYDDRSIVSYWIDKQETAINRIPGLDYRNRLFADE